MASLLETYAANNGVRDDVLAAAREALKARLPVYACMHHDMHASRCACITICMHSLVPPGPAKSAVMHALHCIALHCRWDVMSAVLPPLQQQQPQEGDLQRLLPVCPPAA